MRGVEQTLFGQSGQGATAIVGCDNGLAERCLMKPLLYGTKDRQNNPPICVVGGVMLAHRNYSGKLSTARPARAI